MFYLPPSPSLPLFLHFPRSLTPHSHVASPTFLSHRLGSAVMSDQPFKNDNSKHQHFQLRPAAAQIHRLEFSIRSTSHNIHVRGHSDTNSNGRNNKNRTHSNNSIKVTSGIRDQSNNRNLEPRAGSAFSFQSTTNIASSADRTMISYPRPTAAAPTLVRLVPSIESSASSSRPPPLTSSRTSAKRPGKAPPAHRLAMAVEQAQTPPKSLIVRLPEEPTMHLKNTTTAPNISVPAFSAPSALDLALHRQHSPPRVSSDISFGCSRPAAHYSSVPALPPKPEGVEHAFAHQLTELVGHRSQEVSAYSQEGRVRVYPVIVACEALITTLCMCLKFRTRQTKRAFQSDHCNPRATMIWTPSPTSPIPPCRRRRRRSHHQHPRLPSCRRRRHRLRWCSRP